MAERLDIKTFLQQISFDLCRYALQVRLNHFWYKVWPVISVYGEHFERESCRYGMLNFKVS